MGILDNIKTFFCGAKDSEVEQLEDELDRLKQTLQATNNVLGDCQETSKKQLKELTDLKHLMQKNEAYLAQKVKELTEILGSAIIMPETHVDETPVVLDVFDGFHRGFNDAVFADQYYFTFTKDAWMRILAPLQKLTKKLLGKWTSNISDCDDFALVLSGLVAIWFRLELYQYQGAFSIAWSRSHAYNIIVDKDRQMWVYEPQSHKIIGKLEDETLKDLYKTKKVWFVSDKPPE